MFTRKELLEKIKENDTKFFADLYYNGQYDKNIKSHFKIVYDQNYGDGNEWYIAFNFPEANINVCMDGYYSSHDSSEFDSVSIGIPYQFTETRYKSATLSDLRDLNIDEIVGDED